MSTVYIGSARIDEHGNAHGGDAGDQARELVEQAWYKHEKGWVVIRAKDPAARPKIGAAMRAACANPNIGYDQWQRDTLYAAAKPVGFNPGQVKVKCETDCSALVRVCLAYAGIMAPNFRTVSEPAILKATGKVEVLTDPLYTEHSDRLMAGDILCTPVSGHTVIVLNDGEHAHDTIKSTLTVIPPTIKLGGTNAAVVRKMQEALTRWYNLKVTGKFDLTTYLVLRRFQKVNKLEVDGICGPRSWGALLN